LWRGGGVNNGLAPRVFPADVLLNFERRSFTLN
jgi:hypothetical protein